MGTASVATRAEIADLPEWRAAFAGQRKDARYYEIVDETIRQGFDYRYLVLQDPSGTVRAIQPVFLLDQDLLQGVGGSARAIVDALRRILPQALTIRTLMVGCAAGEGHLPSDDPDEAAWVACALHAALLPFARKGRARMIVLKEFPADYRDVLRVFAQEGYAKVPSLPMTRLDIAYPSFEAYMTGALSRVTRKGLRRKFKDAAAAAPITMEVVEDVGPYVDEVYPLYLAVYGRSPLQFERLTPDYLCELGRRMPDKARFFLWRQEGRLVAFSLCLVQGRTIYDEYVGLDYSVALDLHLYFYTFRDIVEWAIANGYTEYRSSALNYDPKLHFRCELAPLDLYVAHTSPWVNRLLGRILPWLEPTRGEPILAKFPNAAQLWDRPAG